MGGGGGGGGAAAGIAALGVPRAIADGVLAPALAAMFHGALRRRGVCAVAVVVAVVVVVVCACVCRGWGRACVCRGWGRA